MLTDLLQIVVFIIALLVLAFPLGIYIAKVMSGENSFLSPILKPLEMFIYKVSGVKDHQMSGKEYLFSLLIFNLIGGFFLYLLLLFQNLLPLNPMGFDGMSWHLAFNTAVSFMTNTNWQSYSGETTLSYFSQMVGLTVQNFLSAATGLAVLVALIRGLSKKGEVLGNFWVDLVRSVVYLFIPLALILSLFFVSQGVIQNFADSKEFVTLDGDAQLLPNGPVASQVAIKQIGTNGGGYFGTNSAHPYENPTPLSNFMQMLSILLIPVSLVFMFGRMINSKKQGRVILLAMGVMFIIGLGAQYYFEKNNSIDGLPSYMEGKELRFGLVNSVLWAQVTTCASNGSVNAMQDSFSPISGMVSMLNMMSGEVIFGGVGAGLYGILMYVIITVFLAGLMVGRTPEYLGKKIEKREIIMAVLAVLTPSFIILLFTSIAILSPVGLITLSNQGPHGLSQILYAFSSAAGNNGSAFAGLGVDNVFYNLMIGIAMLFGRFAVIIPVLLIADNMVRKDKFSLTIGTFKTDSVLFAILLIFVVVFIGLLTFFPVLLLGPVAEHLLYLKGIAF